MSSFLDFADKIAGEALDGARAAIKMQFATLDDVGADALLLRALSHRAGRERYNRETLDWLIDTAYWTGFSPYILHLAVGIEPTKAEGYDPFSLYHKEVPHADEDERDPYPTELPRRAALNMGDHISAAERYGRLALKAQSNCRATIEALAKLHQPREQTVRHVHVNEGGQAVIADQFHHHTGGSENAEKTDQSFATGATSECAALPCPDPLGNGVPIASREREAAMQDARWDKSGRS